MNLAFALRIAAAAAALMMVGDGGQPVFIDDAGRAQQRDRRVRVGADLIQLFFSRRIILLGHGCLQLENSQVHGERRKSQSVNAPRVPTQLTCGERRQHGAVDRMAQRIESEAMIFLPGTEEEGDVRVAVDQCAHRVVERRQIGAGQFSAHHAAREFVELPQQTLPTIEQRQLHHDGRRGGSCTCLALRIHAAAFGPRTALDQGVELRLVLDYLSFVQEQSHLRIKNPERECAADVKKIPHVGKWYAV